MTPIKRLDGPDGFSDAGSDPGLLEGALSIGHKQLVRGYEGCLGQTHCGPPSGVAPDTAKYIKHKFK